MIGHYLAVDMTKFWQADAAFWGLVRDKEVLGKIVAEVAGPDVAAANDKEKAKVLKAIVADHLGGANGRAQVGPWVPKWMTFPPSPYTTRGGVGSVAAEQRLLHILACAAEAEADRCAPPDETGDAEIAIATGADDETGSGEADGRLAPPLAA